MIILGCACRSRHTHEQNMLFIQGSLTIYSVLFGFLVVGWRFLSLLQRPTTTSKVNKVDGEVGPDYLPLQGGSVQDHQMTSKMNAP